MLVSIIIPCYNQGKYLNEALESVYNQTYSTLECLIIDDGSTDNTAEISKEWTKKDTRFKYFYQKNKGVSSARNFGIKLANGDYFQFLDSDDLLHKNKLKASLNVLAKNKRSNSDIVITNFKMISHDSKEILPPFCNLKEEFFSFEGFLFKWNIDFSIQIQCGFFSSALFNTIKFPENLTAQEDWVVWVELMKTKKNLYFLNKTFAYYRINPNSRMETLGIADNQIKLLANFKNILNYDEYYLFTKKILENLEAKNIDLKLSLQNIKNSKTFIIKKNVSKILKKFYFLISLNFYFIF